MIYIVTGDGPRCGSSMMMQSLEAGGMEVRKDVEADEVVKEFTRDDYVPNPAGLYELVIRSVMRKDFPAPAIYDGKVFKLFPPPWGPVSHIVQGDYKVIWVHRPAKERWKSLKMFYGDQMGIAKEGNDIVLSLRDMAADAVLYLMKHGRPDMQVLEIQYNTVLDHPLKTFTVLAEEWGWPINPAKAAKIPDKKFRHF